jgi:hypothetical protein
VLEQEQETEMRPKRAIRRERGRSMIDLYEIGAEGERSQALRGDKFDNNAPKFLTSGNSLLKMRLVNIDS